MLVPGDMLPSFSATDDAGNQVTSQSLLGRWTVIWWYVRADSPG